MMARWTPKAALSRYLRGERGAAAVEFVIWLALLVPAVTSAVDVGVYLYQASQTAHAAQAAANAARATALNNSCTFDSNQTLASCSGLTTATSNAIASSGVLGGSISKISGTEKVLYFCSDAGTNAAFSTSDTSGCTQDAYYYDVKVSFQYQAVFAANLIVNLLNGAANCPAGTAAGTICEEARIRLQ
jgi:Flp pilus assembly protein TadG